MLLALNYHRIARVRPGCDYWGLAVSSSNFRSQLNVLSGEFEIADPAKDCLIAAAQASKVSVLVTFDDGYADQLYAALPALEYHRVPAVLFLASGYIGQPYFWWNAIEAIFRTRSHSGVSVDVERLQKTWESLLDYGPEERSRVVNELLQSAGDRALDSNCRPLTKVETQQLARCPLISFGGHTRSHPWLPHLTANDMLDEIKGGKLDNELLTGRGQVAFAYPFGAMDEQAKWAAAEAGFTLAFTTAPARSDDRTCDLLAYPRLTVKDVSEDEFRRRIRIFMDVRHSC
jgi:peptidoglycan/xylan/chitin deacetylase (PgdA/CDA1 family)